MTFLHHQVFGLGDATCSYLNKLIIVRIVSCCCPCLDFCDGKAHQLLASELLLDTIKENALQNIRPVLDSLMNTSQQIAKRLWCCLILPKPKGPGTFADSSLKAQIVHKVQWLHLED